MQTDKSIVLASASIEHLRRQSIILPALNAIERASAEAITRANRRIHEALSPLDAAVPDTAQALIDSHPLQAFLQV